MQITIALCNIDRDSSQHMVSGHNSNIKNISRRFSTSIRGFYYLGIEISVWGIVLRSDEIHSGIPHLIQIGICNVFSVLKLISLSTTTRLLTVEIFVELIGFWGMGQWI